MSQDRKASGGVTPLTKLNQKGIGQAFQKAPFSPTLSRSARLVVATATAASALTAMFMNSRSAVAANTEYDVTNGQTDLTAIATYTTGGTSGTGVGGSTPGSGPTVTSDVTFDSGVVYTPAAFTLNSSLTFGSLNDLSTTALTIANGGAAADTLTLGGAGNGGNSVVGSNAADLLFVGTGASLTLTGGTGTTAMGIVLGQSGNFDVAGSSTISSIISDGGSGFGITKTAAGTLTLSGENTFNGGLFITQGIVNATTSTSALGGTTGTGAVTLGDATVNLAGTLNGDTRTFANPITLTSGVTALLTIGNGTTGNLSPTFSGGIITNGTAFTIATSGTGVTTESGLITGSGNLTVSNAAGAATTLTASNTGFSGSISLTAGILNANQATASQAFTTLGTGQINLGGGNLKLTDVGTASNQDLITGNGTTGNNVVVSANANIDVNRPSGPNTGNTFVFNNLNIGANTLSVTGANTYAARFAGTTTLGGNVTFNPATANLTLSGGISDGGSGYSVTKTGAAALILSGADTYGGSTTISGGTLKFAGGSALPGGSAITLGAATLQIANDGAGSNGTIAVGNNITTNGAVTGTIAVGNNGSANTGNTVAFGALNNGTAAQGNSTIFTFTGANGYLESFTSLALAGAGGNNTTLTPTSTSVTISGAVTNQMTTVSPASKFDTLFLDGTSSGNAINGVISDAAIVVAVNQGDTRITKQNTSTWTLGGANAYRGPTVINNGTLKLGLNNAVPTLSAITVSGTGAGVTGIFDLAGFNETTNSLTLGGSTATSAATVTNSSGSSTLTLAGGATAVTYSATNNPLGATISTTAVDLSGAAQTFTVGDSTTAANDLSISSVIQNGSVIKAGAGLLALSGANTYAGGTTVSAGTLEFVNTAAQPASGTTTVAAGGALALGVGGAGFYSATNVSQYFTNTLARVNTSSRSLGIDTTAGDFNLGGLTLPTGAVAINKLGANALNLGAITRAVGSTVDFSVTAGTLTTTTANTGTSILGGYATFGGSTWAVSAGDGTNAGAITGLAAGSYTPSVALTTAPGSTANVDFQVTNTTAYSAQTINSLRFNTAAATTLTLSGATIITSGGILKTSAVGNNGSTITGGTLEGSAGGDLIVINNDTSERYLD